MAFTLMGKKRGMMQFFDEKGNVIVCTMIEVEPNVVTQIKTKENDGYISLQLGFEKIKGKTQRTIESRTGKPQLGLYKKVGVEPRRFLLESTLESTDEYNVGQEIGVNAFEGVEFVDATAISKGKGHQGVMKRWGHAGGPASHGSGFHRHGGSTGMRSTPGRGLPGVKKSGQMGNERVTVQNLRIVRIDPVDNVIVVKGQVPGPRNGLVYLTQAKKKHAKKRQK
jgi:large subunit ribosomal protein L3